MVRLREELDREREERNYFQLERDKVNTFWEITKRQLEERKAEIRNKDREMEDAEERHQVEIKARLLKYKQNIWAYHLFFTDVWKGISDNWESREIFIHHIIMLKLFFRSINKKWSTCCLSIKTTYLTWRLTMCVPSNLLRRITGRKKRSWGKTKEASKSPSKRRSCLMRTSSKIWKR